MLVSYIMARIMAQSRQIWPHCFLFSIVMYLLRLARDDTLTAWWYLLSAC